MLRIAFMVSIFAFSLVGRNHAVDRRDTFFVRAAIFFALFADLFLILNVNYEVYIVGIASFSICQLLHFIRYAGTKKFKEIAIAVPIVFYVFPADFDIVVKFSAVYIACFLLSAYGAAHAFKIKKYDGPNRHFIIAATLFFLISDVCVLLYNSRPLTNYQDVFLFLIWIFCLPAHILLSLSKIKLR